MKNKELKNQAQIQPGKASSGCLERVEGVDGWLHTVPTAEEKTVSESPKAKAIAGL